MDDELDDNGKDEQFSAQELKNVLPYSRFPSSPSSSREQKTPPTHLRSSTIRPLHPPSPPAANPSGSSKSATQHTFSLQLLPRLSLLPPPPPSKLLLHLVDLTIGSDFSFLSLQVMLGLHYILLWKGSWFIQEKSSKVLTSIVSARPKQNGLNANGKATYSKKKITASDDVLKGLVEWLCIRLKKPSHPTRSIPAPVNCLATLLKEPVVRCSFVQADGVKLLVTLISPASTQQSIQLLYETCLCVWLLSYYEPAIEYLATSRALPRLLEVVKGSTKEKVVRLIVLTFKNLLDEDLLEALNNLEEGLKDNIKKVTSTGLQCTNFEENDFQTLCVLLTILETSGDPRALAVACYDLAQFIQYSKEV
ncbi:unnamed protein product [Lactuca virosa]|uniref:ATPase V1 complex subunit H C-terminal domain-containing protein n=1 Tax=Lactuca virosa TaxID=75947 RepID=A0AAU9NZH2_9ASTR|nr:unnamed protein product [Lactuca virosa]